MLEWLFLGRCLRKRLENFKQKSTTHGEYQKKFSAVRKSRRINAVPKWHESKT